MDEDGSATLVCAMDTIASTLAGTRDIVESVVAEGCAATLWLNWTTGQGVADSDGNDGGLAAWLRQARTEVMLHAQKLAGQLQVENQMEVGGPQLPDSVLQSLPAPRWRLICGLEPAVLKNAMSEVANLARIGKQPPLQLALGLTATAETLSLVWTCVVTHVSNKIRGMREAGFAHHPAFLASGANGAPDGLLSRPDSELTADLAVEIDTLVQTLRRAKAYIAAVWPAAACVGELLALFDNHDSAVFAAQSGSSKIPQPILLPDERAILWSAHTEEGIEPECDDEPSVEY
eukprot:SAG31_NODE_676_length_12896_cov_10.122060_8_plen_290_part_00